MSTNLRIERPDLTAQQISIVRELSATYEINPADIAFLDSGEPWLPSRVRLDMARKSEQFQSIEEYFDQFIPAVSQVVHNAELVDRDGRRFKRSGVATIGEKLNNGEIADEHELAGSRAIGAVCDAAGFNPLRNVRARGIAAARQAIGMVEEDPAQIRLLQLKMVHALAREAGLIVNRPGSGEDATAYREFLAEHYGVISVAGMTETERASVIAALRVKARG